MTEPTRCRDCGMKHGGLHQPTQGVGYTRDWRFCLRALVERVEALERTAPTAVPAKDTPRHAALVDEAIATTEREDAERARRGMCSLCGAQRVPLNRPGTEWGACSLVPGRDGKGGCPDPMHDYNLEHPTAPQDTPGGTASLSIQAARLGIRSPLTAELAASSTPRGPAATPDLEDSPP